VHLVIVGGSDAGISAALRARELDPSVEATVVVADAYPNFSICGIPYYLSGEVGHWRDLAHRTTADLEAAGIKLVLDTRVTDIEVAERSSGRKLHLQRPDRTAGVLSYDRLVVGTGAVSVRPPIQGLSGPDALGAADGVHLLHTIGDARAVMESLTSDTAATAVVVGAGYIGLELAEALTTRGLQVTQIEALPEVLPTVDAGLGGLVRAELEGQGVTVLTSTVVHAVHRSPLHAAGRVRVEAGSGGLAGDGRSARPVTLDADVVVVVVGVRPDTDLAVRAGARVGVKGAIEVDDRMRTGLPAVFAAGDCVVTHHRLLGTTWLPLGTTAHKQGRVAGENAAGGDRRFTGSLGTQVVKVFDVVAARTGLRDHEAATVDAAPDGRARRWHPITVTTTADDHKAYFPGATSIAIHLTGNDLGWGAEPGRLLGAQLVGRRGAEISKRVDVLAEAIHYGATVDEVSDLDLSYTPPLGSPWDAVQIAAQSWTRHAGSSR
jgi:NADPH-dependent 2,4-dienoyl-CoA reductase/sulfur reductase-like enzyme